MINPSELSQCARIRDEQFPMEAAQRNTLQREPLDFLGWILESLRASDNDSHPLISEVCTMGRTITKYWCAGCNSSVGEDRNNSVVHLTVSHTSANGCTIQECLDRYFSKMESNVSFSSNKYSHT